MTFPMDNRMVAAYVGWLIVSRKVSSASINQYMSGLRVAHLKHGVMPNSLRSDMIASIIKGKENEENSTQNKIPRLAMTIPVLKLLKALLADSELELSRKRLLWAISCMAFHGSFRIHELLSKEALSYDPKTTLLGCDIRGKLQIIVHKKVHMNLNNLSKVMISVKIGNFHKLVY